MAPRWLGKGGFGISVLNVERDLGVKCAPTSEMFRAFTVEAKVMKLFRLKFVHCFFLTLYQHGRVWECVQRCVRHQVCWPKHLCSQRSQRGHEKEPRDTPGDRDRLRRTLVAVSPSWRSSGTSGCAAPPRSAGARGRANVAAPPA